MNSITALGKLRKNIQNILNEENVEENCLEILEVTSSVNLFTSNKVRDFVKNDIVDFFELFIIKDVDSATSALVCYTIFKVLIFEQNYEFVSDDSAFETLLEIPGAKESVVLQYCASLLNKNDSESLSKYRKRFQKLWKKKKNTLSDRYKQILGDIIADHENAAREILEKELFEEIVESLNLNLTEEMEVDEAEDFKDVAKEYKIEWSSLLEAYARGNVKLVTLVSNQASNAKLLSLIDELNVEQHPASLYGPILAIIRGWLVQRPGFKLSITQKLVMLMEREVEYRTESLNLLTAITEDKSSGIMRHTAFMNMCIALAHCPKLMKQPITENKLKFAAAKARFLGAVVRNLSQIPQHAIISGYISDLITLLDLSKNGDIEPEKLISLEQSLKSVVDSAGKSGILKYDLPFFMASNVRAFRTPSLPMLVALRYCDHNQTSLLSTNLPQREKQLFSFLMQHYEKVKTRVG